MTRRPVYFLFAALLLAACNRAAQNKDAVREGVVEHLKKGNVLDLNSVEVTVADVKFEGNKATARVAFKPKSDPRAGMSMSYNLERRGEKWQVIGRGAGHAGSGMGMGGGMTTPPSGEGQMAPGHPPAGDATKSPQTKGDALPPGHPPVNEPAKPRK